MIQNIDGVEIDIASITKFEKTYIEKKVTGKMTELQTLKNRLSMSKTKNNKKYMLTKCFRFAKMQLSLLSIKLFWKNWKIERFFGTLKYHLYHSKKKIKLKLLQPTLDEFRFYYNHIRPHQHLSFKTPSEVWDDKEMLTSKDTSEIYSFRGKYLTLGGFYMRR